jgi:hypothetical protein
MGSAPPRKGRTGVFYGAAVALVLAAVACAHLLRLAEVPRGLYFDECSIGLNAALVAADGRDEHGVFLPVFFTTFGNLKNPLCIYAAALLFRIAGVSDRALRATPALFFLVFLAGLWALARRLFPGSRATALYALAAGGFLPWFFTLSRFAVEASSQVPLLVWSLVLAHRACEEEPRRPLLAAAALGLVTGLSVYSYTTARLLTFLFALSLVAVYPHRRWLARHTAMLAGFAVALVPYGAYAVTHPGELTRRFDHLTYLHDAALSPAAKLARFAEYYAASFTPSFLLVSGDPNRRHSTGATGEVFATVLVLAGIGLAWLARRALRRGGDRFARLLLVNAAAAPLGMALTEPQHAMRGAPLGLYLLIASCYGFALVAGARRTAWRRATLAAVAVALAGECGHLVWSYFGPYAAVSEEAYLSYDFEGLVATAIAGGAKEVVVVPRPRVFYALPAFYRLTRPAAAAILRTGPAVAAPGTCIVYFVEDLAIRGGDRYPSQLLGSRHQALMRCYVMARLADPE